jgi:hypothetical protein
VDGLALGDGDDVEAVAVGSGVDGSGGLVAPPPQALATRADASRLPTSRMRGVTHVLLRLRSRVRP